MFTECPQFPSEGTMAPIARASEDGETTEPTDMRGHLAISMIHGLFHGSGFHHPVCRKAW